MRFGFFTTLAIALILPAVASAQALGGSLGNTDSFTVSVSPQYPAPNSAATISLLSSTIDLTNAMMAVSVVGAQIDRGNVQPVAISVGKTGSVTSILITVTSGGAQYSQSLTVQPQDVALVAEPVASAPVLYPGKPLVPLEGSVRVVAVASFRDAGGKVLDPATLSYAWTVDGVQIANASGIGKEAVMVASPLQYRERPVSVAVQSQEGSLVGGASISLTAAQPSVRIYENDPLLGIRFDHALSGDYAITGTETDLYAAPFSLSLDTGTPRLQWFLNGSAAQTGPSLTLRPTGSGQGNASLSLTASAGTSAEATANLSLSFGATPSSNFFGL